MLEDFNPEAFINCHDFPDLDAVLQHVRRVDQDPSLYHAYLRAPVFAGQRWDSNRYLEEEPVRQRFETIFAQPCVSRPLRHLDKFRYLYRFAERRVHRLIGKQ